MKRIVFVLAMSASLFCVACAKKEAAATAVSAEGGKKILSVMFGGGTPLYMDPALNADSQGSNTIMITHAGLMGYRPLPGDNQYEIAPDLAESYTVSEDGLTYVFTMRKGLKWSDGADFHASEVLKSWQRTASAELGADYGYLFELFEGYDEGHGKLNIEVDDEAGTLTCHMAFVAPYFLDLLAMPMFFPVRTEIADNEGVWATKVEKNFCLGPFVMTKYAVDDVIVFEKNPYYWNADAVKLDQINVYLASESVAILTAYENGTVQYIDDSIVPTEFDRIRQTYGDEFRIHELCGTYYVLFNVHKDVSPMGKSLSMQEQSKARYALTLLPNRAELVEGVTQGGQVPATGFFPVGLSDGLNADVRSSSLYGKWYEGTNTPSSANAKYTEDQVEACKILMDLGYSYTGTIEGGDIKFNDFPAIEFSFNNSGANQSIIEYVQETWNRFGIQSIINQDAWSTLQVSLKKGNAEAARMGWVCDYNDCTNFLGIFLSNSGNNYPRLGRDVGEYTKYSDVTKDAGVGAYWGHGGNQTWRDAFDIPNANIKRETNAEKRAEMCADAERVLMETGSVCPLYFYTRPTLTSSRVKGILNATTGKVTLTYVDIVD